MRIKRVTLTSPIMQHSCGDIPDGMAELKKYGLGLPMTVAVLPVEYSRPRVKHPGPTAKPSLRLKYFPSWTAINLLFSFINTLRFIIFILAEEINKKETKTKK